MPSTSKRLQATTAFAPIMVDETAAAAAVGLSVNTIRELDGFPPAVRIGRRKLYRYADLQAWAASLAAEREAAAGSYDHEWES